MSPEDEELERWQAELDAFDRELEEQLWEEWRRECEEEERRWEEEERKEQEWWENQREMADLIRSEQWDM